MSRRLISIIGPLAVIATAAQAEWDNDLSKIFAYCAGRLSAEVEHSWLMGTDETERLEDLRDGTLALLGSLVADPDAGLALERRIMAKHAHAELLRDATFQTDPDVARRAAQLASMRIGACSAFLLG